MVSFPMGDPHYNDSNVEDVDLFRLVHEAGTFIYTGPCAYHDRLKCGYNVSETVNYENAAWVNVEMVGSMVEARKLITHAVSFSWLFIS